MQDIKRKINLVTAGRISLSTIIFLTVYLTNFFGNQYKLASLFYWGLSISLVLNIPLLVLTEKLKKNRNVLFYFHLIFDFILANFIVFLTGGIEAPFSLLYIFIIMYSSLFLSFYGVLFTTGAVCASFIIINFVYIFIFTQGSSITRANKYLILSSEVYLLGFIVLGILTAFLSERIRRTTLRIEQQHDHIQDLKDYNEYILSSLRSGILTTDLHFYIVKVNAMGQEILKLTEEKILQKSALELLGLSCDEKLSFNSAISNEKALRFEKWYKAKDRTQTYLGISVSPLIIRGSVKIGYVFIFQDLTEIKRLENEIELQRKMAAIGHLSAAIAHEIRNPLASMMGSIQVLQGQLKLNDSQENLMNIILRESRRLNRIINDFLEFASDKKFSPTNFDILDTLKETITLFKNSPEVSRNHTFKINKGVDKMPFYGDHDKIKQAFWNLTKNAVKAMQNGGSLSINCNMSKNSYIIEFNDTGVGMSDEEIKHIFEPFQGKFPHGLGLGMAIVYRVISDHDGKIDIDSTPGKGTSIKIILPINSSYYKNNEDMSN